MSNSRGSAWTVLPLMAVITAATVTTILTTTAAVVVVLNANRRNQRPNSTRPVHGQQVVSHLTVYCHDLDKSLQFYLAIGFLEVSRTNDAILLSLPQKLEFSPYLLLQQQQQQQQQLLEIKDTPSGCTAAGYGRIALLVSSIIRSSNHLQKTLHLEPIAKPVTDTTMDQNGNPVRTITSAAWKDPDGTVVELAESMDHSSSPGILYVMQALGLVQYPRWIHCNINVTNFQESIKAYRQLGFQITSDHGRVKNKLYRAWGIPDPGIARHVAQLRREHDSFQVDAIEWEDPPTIRDPRNVTGLGSFALTTSSSDIGRIPVGWEAHGPVKDVVFPKPLGTARTRKLLDPDGTIVELVDFR